MSNELRHMGEAFIEGFLAHYSSEYYDPVKAKEYYERTKELKGRRSASGLSKAGREVWKVAKAGISEEKKGVLKDTSEDQKVELVGLRKTAAEKRKMLSEKISALLKKTSEETKKELEAVPKVPKGLSKEARAKAALKRKEELAKIRGEANEDKKGTREKGNADRKKMATDLKGVLTKTKEKYSQMRDQIKADYEAKYQAEYDAIKGSV